MKLLSRLLVALALLVFAAPLAQAQSVPLRTVNQQHGIITPYDYTSVYPIGGPIGAGLNTLNDSTVFQAIINLNAGDGTSGSPDTRKTGAHIIIPPRTDGLPWRLVNIQIPSNTEVECIGHAQIRVPTGVNATAGPIFNLKTTTTQLVWLHGCVLDGESATLLAASTGGVQEVLNQGVRFVTNNNGTFTNAGILSTGIGDPRNKITDMEIGNFTGPGLIWIGRGAGLVSNVNVFQSNGVNTGAEFSHDAVTGVQDPNNPAVYWDGFDSQWVGGDIGANNGSGFECRNLLCAQNTFQFKVWGSGNGVAAHSSNMIPATGNQLVKISTNQLDSTATCTGPVACPLSVTAYYFGGVQRTGINGLVINSGGATNYITTGCNGGASHGATCLSGSERRMMEYFWINGDVGTGQGQLAATPPSGGWVQDPGWYNIISAGNNNRFIGVREQDGYFGGTLVKGKGDYFEMESTQDGFSPRHWYSHRCLIDLDGAIKNDFMNVLINDNNGNAVSDFPFCVVHNAGTPQGIFINATIQNNVNTNQGGVGDAGFARTLTDADGDVFAGFITVTGTPLNGETMVVGPNTYTFVTAPTALTGTTHNSTLIDSLSVDPTSLGWLTGYTVFGTNIPTGALIVSMTATSVTLSKAATDAVAGKSLTALGDEQIVISSNNATQATNIKNCLNKQSPCITGLTNFNALASAGIVTAGQVVSPTTGQIPTAFTFTEAVTGIAMSGSGTIPAATGTIFSAISKATVGAFGPYNPSTTTSANALNGGGTAGTANHLTVNGAIVF